MLSHTLPLIYNKSIEIEPSVIGQIAKSVALVGSGERHKAYRTCDIALLRFHPTYITFLLLIKVRVPCRPLGCPQLLILPRLSSCLWPESMMTRYPV